MLLQSVKLIWADCGDIGLELFDRAFAEFNCALEIVKRRKGK
jgi:hypothetical protein